MLNFKIIIIICLSVIIYEKSILREDNLLHKDIYWINEVTPIDVI